MPFITVNGVGVPAEWVERAGEFFLRSERTGEWLPLPELDPMYTRGTYGVCAYCGQRPCSDPCPKQTWPDTLHTKASRAGLTIEAWLARWADAQDDGATWFETYPEHPAAIAWRETSTQTAS